MCLTNNISISSSNINNSSSLFNNNDNDKKENIEDIVDVIFDYNGNGDNELTLRFVTMRVVKLEFLSRDKSFFGSRGWWSGRLLNSESVGIFSANFVANSQPNLRIIDYNDLHIGETIGVREFGYVFRGKFGDIDVAIKTAKSLA